jgi:hypothetical protein
MKRLGTSFSVKAPLHASVVSEKPARESDYRFVICTRVRDEAPYLKEWIEYHRMIGFESFLLMNDNSTDDTQCLLDEYASRGIVKRIPQEIDDNVYGRPQVLNNIVSENDRVFDVCAKHLASQPDANRTWMLTHDVDEFVWFNKTSGIDSLQDAIQKIVQNGDATKGYSLSIPRLRFGSSGHNEYSNELVINRFQQRYNHDNCPPGPIKSWSKMSNRNFYATSFCEFRPVRGSWDNDKSMSLVSELALNCVLPLRRKRQAAICNGPHRHTIKNQRNASVLQASLESRTTRRYNKKDKRYIRNTGETVAIMHYGTKSRYEFYDRVCSSVWREKYFRCPTCTPEQHFDLAETYSNNYIDKRMAPFARQLKEYIKNSKQIGSNCKTRPVKRSENYYKECWEQGRQEVDPKHYVMSA